MEWEYPIKGLGLSVTNDAYLEALRAIAEQLEKIAKELNYKNTRREDDN